ncbi:AraC family transcriptional regulator [Pontitalea aquivivens]|uniref:AraC family transcriptional regulator n=1 Tax=Pontitalea aquivivens TaxID=3388663 RepID=UPI0039704C88
MRCPANDNNPRVHRWTYTSAADEVSVVLPDGCVDILVSSCGKTGRDLVRVTDWDFSPRQVRIAAGMSLIGYRLRPGVIVSLADLQIENYDLSNLDAEIGDRIRHDQEITEIIDVLGLPGSSVERLARQQGVSERTLQRHFKKLSLPTPVFWRQLGRARRAVQALPYRVPLSEIALEYGYSDQAHMTREFVRWFGRTPEQLRRNSSVMDDLAQPGLGNWSEEITLKPAGLA